MSSKSDVDDVAETMPSKIENRPFLSAGSQISAEKTKNFHPKIEIRLQI